MKQTLKRILYPVRKLTATLPSERARRKVAQQGAPVDLLRCASQADERGVLLKKVEEHSHD